MKNLRAYLAEAAGEGERVEGGKFTLAPEVGRAKMAESVPPSLRQGWAGFAFLQYAFEQCGVDLFHYGQSSPLLAITPRPWLYASYRPRVRDYDMKPVAELLEKCIFHPFSETSPAGSFLSRALLIFLHLDVSLVFRFNGYEVDPIALCSSEEALEKARGAIGGLRLAFRKEELEVVFSTCDCWTQLIKAGKNDNPYARCARLRREFSPTWARDSFSEVIAYQEPKAFGVQLSLESAWTHAPSKVLMERVQLGWFQYRVAKVALLEHLIPGQEEEGLPVHASLAPESSESLERPSAGLTLWQKLRGAGETLILRSWSRPPEVSTNGLRCKGVFTAVASDTPSGVYLYNDQGAPQQRIPLAGFPPGIVGVVHWPGLKPTTFGEGWVQDEEYQRAERWCHEQGLEMLQILSAEWNFVVQMLSRDHLGSSYRGEVLKRLSYFKDPPEGGLSD